MDPSSARQPQWVGVGWDTLEMGDGRRRVEGGGYLVCMCVREWDREGWGGGWRGERGGGKKRQNPSSLWRRRVWSQSALLSGPVSAETTFSCSLLHPPSSYGATARCFASAPVLFFCSTQPSLSHIASELFHTLFEERGEDPKRWIKRESAETEKEDRELEKKEERKKGESSLWFLLLPRAEPLGESSPWFLLLPGAEPLPRRCWELPACWL